MDEGGVSGVKAMKPVGLLVYKGVVLRNKLPANFRRDDVGMDGGRSGIVRIDVDGGTGSRGCHDAKKTDVRGLLATC